MRDLGGPQAVARRADGSMSFDLVWDEGSPEDVAATNQFVRFSAPYERMDLDLSSSMTSLVRGRPTRFVTTGGVEWFKK